MKLHHILWWAATLCKVHEWIAVHYSNNSSKRLERVWCWTISKQLIEAGAACASEHQSIFYCWTVGSNSIWNGFVISKWVLLKTKFFSVEGIFHPGGISHPLHWGVFSLQDAKFGFKSMKQNTITISVRIFESLEFLNAESLFWQFPYGFLKIPFSTFWFIWVRPGILAFLFLLCILEDSFTVTLRNFSSLNFQDLNALCTRWAGIPLTLHYYVLNERGVESNRFNSRLSR